MKPTNNTGNTVESNSKRLQITPPNMKIGAVWIQGDTALVINKFSKKAQEQIRATQEAGTTSRSKKNREAKDFNARFQGARHLSFEGWDGIPAAAFRNACIDACRLVGYKMTMAKMSIKFAADGFDETEGSPLVRIIGEAPRKLESMVRLANGACDIAVRAQWLDWSAKLRFEYDADQFSSEDIVNLIARAGAQVGVCEGRPFSKNSNGMGWGTFKVVTDPKVQAELEKKAAKLEKKVAE